MKIKKSCFSLLELIICLGILAVLSSFLLENFADVKARECSSLTAERGNHIREVINGHNTSDGISAFLSDMGRFPKVYIPTEGDGSGGRRLAELYDPSIWYHSSSGTALNKQKTISAEDIRDICLTPSGSTFPAVSSGIRLPYPEVSMTVGWNGPYINIADPIRGNFFDGWGNSWKIISNYHFTTSGSSLVPSSTIYATETELNNTPARIDGIASYGANDAQDSNSADAAAADMDQSFIFAHNMDNHSSENIASLFIELKLRDQQTGRWIKLPAISAWRTNTSYAKGEIAVANNNIYCCSEAHSSGSSFSSSSWINFNSAAVYDPTVHGASSFSGLCIYQNTYYLRNTANSESSFTASNWLRIAGLNEIPDSISLLIFTPVMQGNDHHSRIMQLGYYHFFRNLSSENEHGVRPLYGASSPVQDIDCTGDTSTIYNSGTDYNARYLVAEDHSASSWNEFYIKRLIPGQRRIFCIMYNSRTQISCQSQVEILKLKPGSNSITICLERKL